VSDASRHAEFLARRLRAMGIAIEYQAGATWAQGSLELSAAPFESLADPIRVTHAAFYTLGHGRLKFCEPRILFDLPAIEVASCETRAEVERALRRAWQAMQRDLAAARNWLARLGSAFEVSRQGTRLRLIPGTGLRTHCEVRSADEIQLPSAGPLATASIAQPSQRRFRPLRGLENASELDLALENAARACARPRGRPSRPGAGSVSDGPRAGGARVLALAGDEALLTQLERQLPPRGIAVECHRDPERALAAFHLHSFDAVLIESRVARSDGLEVALRVREIPGVDDLPVALIDSRDNAATRASAAQVGVLSYAVKPLAEAALASLLADLLEHGTRRRFSRFRVRLAVRAGGSDLEDRTEQIARGGVSLRSSRALGVGQHELYSIALPAPHEPVHVHGRVVTRVNLPGSASALAGVRFADFEGGGEARWIEVIEALARDAAEKRETD
jgi:DNA-binding response OmpR family regulator